MCLNLLLKSKWISKLFPNIPITTLILKIKIKWIQIWLNPLLKSIYVYIYTYTYCQKLDFEAFPQYSNENLNNKNKKSNLWDGTLIKNLQVAIYFH